jgi:hypothetical protein
LQAKRLVEASPTIAVKKAVEPKLPAAPKKTEAEPKLASQAKKPVVQAKAAARTGALIDDKLVSDIKDAAKAEKSRSSGDQ